MVTRQSYKINFVLNSKAWTYKAQHLLLNRYKVTILH